MSQRLANLLATKEGKKPLSRAQCLALVPDPVFDDGRTKQAYKDECDINKIMARFAVTETITHLAKHQGTYSDYSDYDFFNETRKLTEGRQIFDDLPAEVRREFGQSPAAFFAHVNDPKNAALPDYGLPALAKPGTQLVETSPPDADKALVAAKQSLDPPTGGPTPPVTTDGPEAGNTTT